MTALADLADLAAPSSTDDLMFQARIMAFGAGYPGEVIVDNIWTAREFEASLPYGEGL